MKSCCSPKFVRAENHVIPNRDSIRRKSDGPAPSAKILPGRTAPAHTGVPRRKPANVAAA